MIRLNQKAAWRLAHIGRGYSTKHAKNSQESIRNIGILAHIDAGERFLDSRQ